MFLIYTVSVLAAVPSDWQRRVQAGQALVTQVDPKPGYAASIGNGYIATELDRGISFGNGMTFMNGLYSGLFNVTPSHRAQMPSVTRLWVPSTPNQRASFVAAALDLERAVYLNRTLVNTTVCSVELELGHYMHRLHRSLAVSTISAKAISWHSGLENTPCEIDIVYSFDPYSPDFDFALNSVGNETWGWTGLTVLPELPGGGMIIQIVRAYEQIH